MLRMLGAALARLAVRAFVAISSREGLQFTVYSCYKYNW
jgi:hypothetical protein